METALVTLTDGLHQENDMGVLILLDLSAAFDTFNHGILLDRLVGLGAGRHHASVVLLYMRGCCLVLGNYTMDSHRDLSFLHLYKHLHMTAGRDRSGIWSKTPPICEWHSVIFLLNWILRVCGIEEEVPGKAGWGPINRTSTLTSLSCCWSVTQQREGWRVCLSWRRFHCPEVVGSLLGVENDSIYWPLGFSPTFIKFYFEEKVQCHNRCEPKVQVTID